MQRVDGRLVLSPTDLTKHVACPHITTLDLRRLDGEPALVPAAPDDALALVFAKGIEHEARHLAALRERGLRVVEIDTSAGKQAAESATLAAMRHGADVVYQATLYDGAWVGHADFLLRTGRPSSLGGWSYDIADTKLARRLKVPALLQMATYAVRLADLQGAPPRQLVVVTGDRAEHPWRLVDVESYAARLRDRLVRAVEERPATEPVPVSQCAQCRWLDTCTAEWRRSDDLSQVAGMRVDQRQALRNSGIRTMTQLAGLAADDLKGILSATTRERLVAQARLQHSERTSGGPAYELLDPQPGQGLSRLPEPSPGDVYLDFEGDPWAEGGAGREYLAGLWERSGEFTARWAHSAAEEKRLTGDLVDELIRRWQGDPQMHVYHYAAYEVTALKRLTGRHGTHEAELDQLLRAERFVDLYAVVRQGVRISKASYSIKKLEDFYWGRTRSAGTEQVTDAMTSIVDYERWLVEADQSILDRILAYNREDCRSTHDLQAWLEDRRAELSGQGVEVPRPTPPEPKEVTDEERAEAALAERLLEAGHALLAGCVGWHRREARPAWWDYFHYSELDTEALIEDATAIGALGEPTARGAVKRSTVWRYPFPAQDCRPVVGDYAPDVDTHMNVGKVLGYDPVAGWVDLSIGNGRAPVVPRGLGVKPPIVDGVLRTSIARTAERVLDGQSPLGNRLVQRWVPPATVLAPRTGETPNDVVVRVGQSLDGQVLAVQGPPGAGKTFAAGALIRALLDSGQTVGVTALSHAVIRNLLDAVGRPALAKVSTEREGAGQGGVQGGPVGRGGPGLVTETTSNEAVESALRTGAAQLVGGTAWLWAREGLAGAVDVLVIDEAGQLSLANAVAVAQAASSLVLLGDPQQLMSPTQATHPYGAGVSALEHFLDGLDTVGADQGVFLDRTWRMHPAVTGYVSEMFYDDRLESAPGLDRQRVQAPGRLSGAGLRWVPVEHDGCVADSAAEAGAVAELVGDLLTGSWTDAQGSTAVLTEQDVLVVAPYNAQVAMLRACLPPGVRVGTVDKFQGQQAPVVVYSMTSSNAALAPRGVDFLYDLHRFNVAISRAKALTIIVGSPALLDAAVHSPEQLRAVNALCRYVDLASGE